MAATTEHKANLTNLIKRAIPSVFGVPFTEHMWLNVKTIIVDDNTVDEDTINVLNTFYVTVGSRPVRSHRLSTKLPAHYYDMSVYYLSAIRTVPATRDSPEDADVVELGEFKTQESVVKRLVHEIANLIVSEVCERVAYENTGNDDY